MATKSMQYEVTPVKKGVRKDVVIKELERYMDRLSLPRIVWYIFKRYKLQLSILINIAFLVAPVSKFIQVVFG